MVPKVWSYIPCQQGKLTPHDSNHWFSVAYMLISIKQGIPKVFWISLIVNF